MEPGSTTASTAPAAFAPGGSRELLKLAVPLILANSFTTIQFTVDRAFLSRYDPDAMGASMQGAMVFWLVMSLLHGTAGYASTFVAQYTGAGRPLRVGPAVWQAIHFGVVAGALFWLMWPLAPAFFDAVGHEPKLRDLEVVYVRSLLGAAMPMALVSALTGFFSGRGDSWTVLGINAVGTVAHVGLDYVLIFGRYGVAEQGIEGAGWACTAGSWASALLALGLFLRPQFRRDYATASGWRPERELFGRLVRFGGPAGLQWMLEALSFTFFMMLVGQLGTAAANATSLTFTLNMLAFLPMMGLGQAVGILVGQRLGEDRPAVAEQTTYTALAWGIAYMVAVAGIYIFAPGLLIRGFEPDEGSPQFAAWPAVAAVVPNLLYCVAAYSLADSINLTFAFALRGAGDTRYVTLLTFALAWPVLIVPTYLVIHFGGGIYAAWAAATAYVFMVAVCFWLRFRTGKWKAMRVIEPAAV